MKTGATQKTKQPVAGIVPVTGCLFEYRHTACFIMAAQIKRRDRGLFLSN
ncbi:hypothetical protein QY95_03177 [Bacillus thermotolerans]|uniref:Uncharacterized protein n=1 Tax=Bacillus thermotolerans TaxID=1221996 RepID=A0A0F5HSS3_BACTR|nr:hypothetical protein QY95_03177 [Bacillus thermotolerans]